MTGKRILCIILICMGALSLSGCNSIYQALSDGTEKILDVASDTVGDTPKNTALDIMDALNEIGGNTVLTSESFCRGNVLQGLIITSELIQPSMRTFQKRNICLAVLMLKESRGMN